MRVPWVLLLGLCMLGCSEVETIPNGDGNYTLVVTQDVIELDSMIQSDAMIAANDICPRGWADHGYEIPPSGASIVWDIRCIPGPPPDR